MPHLSKRKEVEMQHVVQGRQVVYPEDGWWLWTTSSDGSNSQNRLCLIIYNIYSTTVSNGEWVIPLVIVFDEGFFVDFQMALASAMNCFPGNTRSWQIPLVWTDWPPTEEPVMPTMPFCSSTKIPLVSQKSFLQDVWFLTILGGPWLVAHEAPIELKITCR